MQLRQKSYRNLIVWQKAMDLVDAVYELTASWPQDELYGLTNQARRAATSVPANIAEGQGRTGSKELAHHLSIAHGSLCEAETLLLIAQRRRYVAESRIASVLLLADEVSRLIQGMIRSVRRSSPDSRLPTPA